jgi:hypothetical protein
MHGTTIRLYPLFLEWLYSLIEIKFDICCLSGRIFLLFDYRKCRKHAQAYSQLSTYSQNHPNNIRFTAGQNVLVAKPKLPHRKQTYVKLTEAFPSIKTIPLPPCGANIKLLSETASAQPIRSNSKLV